MSFETIDTSLHEPVAMHSMVFSKRHVDACGRFQTLLELPAELLASTCPSRAPETRPAVAQAWTFVFATTFLFGLRVRACIGGRACPVLLGNGWLDLASPAAACD